MSKRPVKRVCKRCKKVYADGTYIGYTSDEDTKTFSMCPECISDLEIWVSEGKRSCSTCRWRLTLGCPAAMEMLYDPTGFDGFFCSQYEFKEGTE